MTTIASLDAASALSVISKAASSNADAATPQASADQQTTSAKPGTVSTLGPTTSIGHNILVSALQAQDAQQLTAKSTGVAPSNAPGSTDGIAVASTHSGIVPNDSVDPGFSFIYSRFSRTTDDINNVIDSAQSLSSQALSDDFYSGKCVEQYYKGNFTFSSLIYGYTSAENAPGISDAEEERLKTVASDLTNAFNNHTLVFQNASQVPELDFTSHVRFTGLGNQAPSGITSSINDTFNWDFAINNPDGKHHAGATPENGTYIYLTW